MHSLVTKIATLALLWSHATAFVHPAARSRFAVTSPVSIAVTQKSFPREPTTRRHPNTRTVPCHFSNISAWRPLRLPLRQKKRPKSSTTWKNSKTRNRAALKSFCTKMVPARWASRTDPCLSTPLENGRSLPMIPFVWS
jgi:hypothetical protein